MDEICSYPDIPKLKNKHKCLCIIGPKENISRFLNDNFGNLMHKIKFGIVFYTHKNILIATCATDKDEADKRIGYLTFLTQIFENIVYLLESKVNLINSNSNFGMFSNRASKFIKNSFYQFSPGKNKYQLLKEDQLNQKKQAEYISETAHSTYSDLKFDFKRLNIINRDFIKFNEKFKDFERRDEKVPKSFTEELSGVGIPKEIHDKVIEVFFCIDYERNEKLLRLKQTFYEKVIATLLSPNENLSKNFKLKQTITKSIYKKKHFDEFIVLFDEKLKSWFVTLEKK